VYSGLRSEHVPATAVARHSAGIQVVQHGIQEDTAQRTQRRQGSFCILHATLQGRNREESVKEKGELRTEEECLKTGGEKRGQEKRREQKEVEAGIGRVGEWEDTVSKGKMMRRKTKT